MIVQHTKMAINSLKSNKVRTFLTLLGIIIGVTSVTTIIGLGEGVKRQVNQQINELGSDLITVTAGKNNHNNDFSFFNPTTNSSSSTAKLSDADLEAIRSTPGVKLAGGIMLLDGSITREGKKVNSKLLAVDENYLELTKQKLAQGQFFGGNLENNNTVVLTSGIAKQLFGSADPIGSTVIIRSINFIVIGVLDTQETANFGQAINNVALIPFPAGKLMNQDVSQMQQATALLDSSIESNSVAEAIKQKLLINHSGEEEFTITTQDQLSGSTDSTFKMLTSFTAAVASISLLVGGIGVMNIMLVTVTERTREIGIRKAIGATKLQILMQFLIEALAITLAGGIIGVITSLGLSYIISSQTAIKPALDPWIATLAIGVSILVGIIFGTWPAIRASRKDPIHSLKHE